MFIEVSADGFYVIRDFPVSPSGFESFTISDSERIDSAQLSRNSDSRDVSRITVSTLPLTSKYPKLPEPPKPTSVLIGEIHSEDTPQKPWTTRLRPRRPPALSLENGSKRRAETSSKTHKPMGRYWKKSLITYIYILRLISQNSFNLYY